MAKKTVAGYRDIKSKNVTKVIRMVKSPKTGSYQFKEYIMDSDKVNDFLSKNSNNK
ncbi:MAG: DUF4295 domain-containing protein [Bacteroidales bacterium]|jgi:hypothetical protein|nr:DUF4295 domain-containing protein [Bacteroidales bacterium]MDI9576000.1 DUF4295 domain-containing protein [Bacteroidota bacterium]MDD2593544.1 DUF4295 domain-containing protein [Bacteroidales bacterium]MDD3755517.1 DUF4295 domain-containing protein [Bacteroidales bacterium]MDY0400696.1 DUF4295 domain-containing protein [Bacteroidales bacterium]